MAPRKLKLVNVTDGKGDFINIEEDNDIKIIKAAYKENNAEDMLSIISKTAEEITFCNTITNDN